MGATVMCGKVDRDFEIDESLQEDWVRATWAAEYLDVDPKKIYRRIRQNRLDSIKVGVILVSRPQILNWDPTPSQTGRPPKDAEY